MKPMIFHFHDNFKNVLMNGFIKLKSEIKIQFLYRFLNKVQLKTYLFTFTKNIYLLPTSNDM